MKISKQSMKSVPERVPTNTDTQSLAEPHGTCLMYSLVSESARPADNSDTPLLVDVAGHDANLARPRSNDTRTVRANQTRLALLQQGVLHLDHVLLGNAFCNAHNKWDLGL